MTIAATAIVIVKLWREVGPLRAENKRLHEERGTLVIGDPNKLQAIRIPGRFAAEGGPSFRVYVPPMQRYIAYVQVNDVPKSGIPERKKLPNHAGILGNFQGLLYGRLEPGENVVTVKTIRRGGKADISLVVATPKNKIPLDAAANTRKDQWPTVVPETFSVFGDGVEARTIAAEGTEPFVLKRCRILGVSSKQMMVSYTTPEPNAPLDGYILWVEQSK
jgi:hypothetical protein